jgi:CPA1 family monovalent cation:H+ antiporter
LALALALGLPDDLPRHEEMVTAAFAVVAFSIFVQGLTMTPLLRILGQLDSAAIASTEDDSRMQSRWPS